MKDYRAPNVIQCCRRHREYPVPLIVTFAWPRVENWCPYCDAKTPLFGPCDTRKCTQELLGRHAAYLAQSAAYLRAVTLRNGGGVTLEDGRKVTWAELDDSERDAFGVIADAGWELSRKAEELV